MILYLTDSGLGGASVGLVVFAAAFLATRWVGSPTVDRYGGATVAVVVLLIEFAGFVLLAAVHALSAVLTGAALVGIGISLTFPATVAMTLRRTGTVSAGTSVGATTSFWDLGILVAASVSGLLAAGPGTPPPSSSPQLRRSAPSPSAHTYVILSVALPQRRPNGTATTPQRCRASRSTTGHSPHGWAPIVDRRRRRRDGLGRRRPCGR